MKIQGKRSQKTERVCVLSLRERERERGVECVCWRDRKKVRKKLREVRRICMREREIICERVNVTEKEREIVRVNE